MNANTDHITGLNAGRIDLDKGFVYDLRIPVVSGCRSRQNIQPARSDDRGSKRNVTWVYKMDLQSQISLSPQNLELPHMLLRVLVFKILRLICFIIEDGFVSRSVN